MTTALPRVFVVTWNTADKTGAHVTVDSVYATQKQAEARVQELDAMRGVSFGEFYQLPLQGRP